MTEIDFDKTYEIFHLFAVSDENNNNNNNNNNAKYVPLTFILQATRELAYYPSLKIVNGFIERRAQKYKQNNNNNNYKNKEEEELIQKGRFYFSQFVRFCEELQLEKDFLSLLHKNENNNKSVFVNMEKLAESALQFSSNNKKNSVFISRSDLKNLWLNNNNNNNNNSISQGEINALLQLLDPKRTDKIKIETLSRLAFRQKEEEKEKRREERRKSVENINNNVEEAPSIVPPSIVKCSIDVETLDQLDNNHHNSSKTKKSSSVMRELNFNEQNSKTNHKNKNTLPYKNNNNIHEVNSVMVETPSEAPHHYNNNSNVQRDIFEETDKTVYVDAFTSPSYSASKPTRAGSKQNNNNNKNEDFLFDLPMEVSANNNKNNNDNNNINVEKEESVLSTPKTKSKRQLDDESEKKLNSTMNNNNNNNEEGTHKKRRTHHNKSRRISTEEGNTNNNNNNNNKTQRRRHSREEKNINNNDNGAPRGRSPSIHIPDNNNNINNHNSVFIDKRLVQETVQDTVNASKSRHDSINHNNNNNTSSLFGDEINIENRYHNNNNNTNEDPLNSPAFSENNNNNNNSQTFQNPKIRRFDRLGYKVENYAKEKTTNECKCQLM